MAATRPGWGLSRAMRAVSMSSSDASRADCTKRSTLGPCNLMGWPDVAHRSILSWIRELSTMWVKRAHPVFMPLVWATLATWYSRSCFEDA